MLAEPEAFKEIERLGFYLYIGAIGRRQVCRFERENTSVNPADLELSDDDEGAEKLGQTPGDDL